MIIFPASTIVDRSVPKNAFFNNMNINNRLRQDFTDKVKSITWKAKFAPSTLNVDDGKTVHEIVVFKMNLKKRDGFYDLLKFIDQMMPRHIVFILEYENNCLLLVNYKEGRDNERYDVIHTFQTEWMNEDELSINLSGQDMDAIYSNLVRQIAGTKITSSERNLCLAIKQTCEQEQIRMRITALERRIANERQPRKKFELHQELKSLKDMLGARQNHHNI